MKPQVWVTKWESPVSKSPLSIPPLATQPAYYTRAGDTQITHLQELTGTLHDVTSDN